MSPASIVAILAGFLFSALFSGVETGSYMVNRIRLRRRELERRPSALVLSRLLRRPHIFVFTVLIGNNIAVYLLSKGVTDLYLGAGKACQTLFGFVPWNAEMAATLTLVFPLFIFGEVVPKNLFRKKADLLMYRLAGPMRLLVWLFQPFTWPLDRLFRLLTRGRNEDAGHELHRLSPDGLKEYFSEGAKGGLISSLSIDVKSARMYSSSCSRSATSLKARATSRNSSLELMEIGLPRCPLETARMPRVRILRGRMVEYTRKRLHTRPTRVDSARPIMPFLTAA